MLVNQWRAPCNAVASYMTVVRLDLIALSGSLGPILKKRHIITRQVSAIRADHRTIVLWSRRTRRRRPIELPGAVPDD